MNFFDLDRYTLKVIFTDLRSEIEEEYYYGPDEVPQEDELHSFAIEIIDIAFQYVQHFKKEEQTFNTMLNCLVALYEGESQFLTERERTNPFTREILEKIQRDSDDKALLLAVKYLSYYWLYLMEPNDPGKGVGDAFLAKAESIFVMQSENGPEAKRSMKGIRKETDVDRYFPVRMKQYFDQYVIGQEVLKKRISMTVYHYLLGQEQKPILIIGDTGSGKNHSILVLKQFFKKEKINIPVLIFDVSRMTPSGYEGDSVDTVLTELKRLQALSGTKKGIVYMDEFCKLIQPNHNSQGENTNGITQGQLLSMLSGDVRCGVDTSKLLFILGGAFADLRELRKNKKRHRTLGFGQDEESDKEKITIRDELVEIGIQRELLGRISSIVQMETLDREAIRKILVHKEIGPLTRKKAEYQEDQLELRIDEDMIDRIVDNVVKEKLGARSAYNIVEELCGDYNFDMIEQGYSWIKLHPGMLNGEPPVFGRSGDECVD